MNGSRIQNHPRRVQRNLLAFALICSLLLVPNSARKIQAEQKQKVIRVDLETAVRIGTTNHFALQAIRNRTAAVRKLLTERWRNYLPTLGLEYSRRRDINQGEIDSINHDVRLNIEQVIFDGGRRSLSYDVAKLDGLLAKSDFKITYNRLRLDVQKSYLRVLAAIGKIMLNRKSLQRARIQLRQASNERKLGFSNRIAVLTVAARVREIELALLKSRNEYRQAMHDFKLVLNLDLETRIHVTGDLFKDFILFPPEPQRELLVRRARSMRPEISKSYATLHRLKKEHTIAKNSWIPRFSVSGFVGRSGDRFPIRTRNWGVNFRLSFPIGGTTSETNAGTGVNRNSTSHANTTSSGLKFFDDLSYGRRVLESKSALGEAVAQHKRLNKTIAIDVYKNYDLLREAWESIRIGNGSVYFRYETLKLMGAGLRVGQAKPADIVFAETELVKVQEQLTDAISRYIMMSYQLEFSAGMDPGALNLFAFDPGRGNTLLSYLILNKQATVKGLPLNAKDKKRLFLKDLPDEDINGAEGKKGKNGKESKMLLDDIELD